jgi:hypothetical protein
LERWVAATNDAILALLARAALGVTLILTGTGWMTVDSGTNLEQARGVAFPDDHPVPAAPSGHHAGHGAPGPLA